MAKKLSSNVLDQLKRSGWVQYDSQRWAKDGYLLEIQKSQNHNFVVEISKMSVANIRLLTNDELSQLIAKPQISHN